MLAQLPYDWTEITADGRCIAPSNDRNAVSILAVLRAEVKPQGRVLEIASGTGQHAAQFSAAFPGLVWQPTDVNPANLSSIAAWATHAGGPNLQSPIVLDATSPGWSDQWADQDVILLVNLLHLIPAPAARALFAEAALAMAKNGLLLIYGPFLRDGKATSDGDAAFDAHLRTQNPAIGCKDLGWVAGELRAVGLSVKTEEMPANNLMLIARKSGSLQCI